MADYTGIIIEPDLDSDDPIARFTRSDSFQSGDTGDAVEQLNLFLVAAGFLTEEELAKQGGDMSIVGTGTKNAAIFFSRSVGLTASDDDRNTISADMLRSMRSFLVDEGVAINAEYYDGNVGGRELIGDFGPTSTTPKVDPDDDIIVPDAKTKNTPGVMAGGTIYKVSNPDGQRDFYIIAYEYPPDSEHSFYYRFADLATLEASIGPNLGGGAVTMGDNINESTLTNWTDGGDSNEILGIEGSFDGYINDLIREVTAKAGITDPTRLSKALADTSIQIIMAKAAEGEWTKAQVLAAMRNNDYYKEVLFPGIENFYGRTDNPEGAYNLYKQNVTSSIKSLGIPRDADGSYDSTIKTMLDDGIDDTEFIKFAPTYLRAAGNDPYRTSLNKWLVAAGQAPITDFDSFYDVLAGTSPAEIQEIVELAGISFVAGQQGFGAADDLISEIARRTDMSEVEVADAFLQSDRDLLALGPEGLDAYGLTRADIVSTRSGFTTGNRSLAEMQSLIRKVKTEQGIADDPTASYFTDFNSEGQPVKLGLKSSINEGA